MQLRPTSERIVTDAQGRLKRADGAFVARADVVGDETWERETVDRDLPTEIGVNIEAYLTRRQAAAAASTPFPAFHANPRTQRDQGDPHGVLARPDVAALRGQEVELP